MFPGIAVETGIAASAAESGRRGSCAAVTGDSVSASATGL
jgi:hypothetical protein